MNLLLYCCTLILRNDENLRQIAIKQFIELPCSYGWDKEQGGLLYYLDTGGYCPVPLEWCSKLWWPHCEALIATLMAYCVSKDIKHWSLFKKYFDYVVQHVSINCLCLLVDYVHCNHCSLWIQKTGSGLGIWTDRET